MSDFDRAFHLIVGEEGGYVNDPHDPGGETNYGISKRAYPNEDIKNLTLERARQIYERDYWRAADCDLLPWGEAVLVFDCAVNQGIGKAKQIHERVAGSADYGALFQAERALHYAGLSTFQRFGRGWMRRLFRTYRESLK